MPTRNDAESAMLYLPSLTLCRRKPASHVEVSAVIGMKTKSIASV